MSIVCVQIESLKAQIIKMRKVAANSKKRRMGSKTSRCRKDVNGDDDDDDVQNGVELRVSK